MTYIPKNLYTDWRQILKDQFQQEYFQNLRQILAQEYANYNIFPAKENIFTALNLTPSSKVKVVIIGQDPYHGPGQAHGLAFSVQKGVALPPSLRNIFIELTSDVGCSMPLHGDLTSWAKQGVLLLNTALTVRKDKPNSHQNIGWEKFTDSVINHLNNVRQPIIFILWGKNAQSKMKFITNPRHHIIKSVHPSPLSAYRGFLGSKPFSKANNFLIKHNQPIIDWALAANEELACAQQ